MLRGNDDEVETSFEAHREGAILLARGLVSDLACWRLRDGRVFLGNAERGAVLEPTDLLDVEYDWRGAPSMAGVCWSVYLRRGAGGLWLLQDAQGAQSVAAEEAFDDVARVVDAACQVSGCARCGDVSARAEACLTERALAWLRAPPGECVVAVIGPRFVIVRDGDEWLAYELARTSVWHDGGITLDDIEAALGRTIPRTEATAIVERKTRHGRLAIVPDLEEAQLVALEAIAAHATATLAKGKREHPDLMCARLEPVAGLARAHAAVGGSDSALIGFESPVSSPDRKLFAYRLRSADLVVAGLYHGNVVYP